MREEPTQMLLHHLVHMIQQQAMYRLEKYDLKPWQAGILFAMNSHGGLSQRELAKMISVTPPTMTVAIKKMESQGYITRQPDEKDQRIVRLFITDKGLMCLKESKVVFQELEDELWHGISAEERLLLRRLLIQMKDNVASSMKKSGIQMCDHHTWDKKD